MTLYEQVTFVDAYKTYCDTAAPELGSTNMQAVTSWKAANNVAQTMMKTLTLALTLFGITTLFFATQMVE
jgi:uncharacterized membrane protein YiaA